MTYTCKTIKGIKVCSNNWSQNITSGSKYHNNIHFNAPIAWMYIDQITFTNWINELKKLGYNGFIWDFKATTDYAYNIDVYFTATSPWVYLIALVIIAIIGFEVYEITVNITSTLKSSPVLRKGTSALLVGAGIAIPSVAIAYLISKIRKK